MSRHGEPDLAIGDTPSRRQRMWTVTVNSEIREMQSRAQVTKRDFQRERALVNGSLLDPYTDPYDDAPKTLAKGL